MVGRRPVGWCDSDLFGGVILTDRLVVMPLTGWL